MGPDKQTIEERKKLDAQTQRIQDHIDKLPPNEKKRLMDVGGGFAIKCESQGN